MSGYSDEALNTEDLHLWINELRNGRPDIAEPQFLLILSKVEQQAQGMFKKFPRIGRFVDVDDVIQNTIVRMMATFRALRPSCRQEFYRLVNALIRRELLDLSKKYYGPCGAGTRELTSVRDQEQTDPALDQDLEWLGRFHATLEGLPTHQREVISLSYYHGWSQMHIADLFQISVRTVQRWQQEAIATLRERIPDCPI